MISAPGGVLIQRCLGTECVLLAGGLEAHLRTVGYRMVEAIEMQANTAGISGILRKMGNIVAGVRNLPREQQERGNGQGAPVSEFA